MVYRVVLLLGLLASPCLAQGDIDFRIGARVPVELPPLFSRGAKFLCDAQKDDGSWPSQSSFGSNGTGVASLCILALMSTGEDPNFGPYARSVHRGLEYLIRKQNPKSGLPGGNAYDFGFTMLALAEAYGAVDEDRIFAGSKSKRTRSIGEALELCVKGACTMKHKTELVSGAWNSTASGSGIPDTSVGGSVMVGLLAARNAGVEVSDDVMQRAIKYFQKMTNKSGTVGYYQTRGNDYGNSIARSSITALVLAIAKRKDTKEYGYTSKYIANNLETKYRTHPLYGDYYQAQALFQVDYKAWQNWNREQVRLVVQQANDDGSIGRSPVGPAYSTAMSMLTLALNYRFLPIYER